MLCCGRKHSVLTFNYITLASGSCWQVKIQHKSQARGNVFRNRSLCKSYDENQTQSMILIYVSSLESSHFALN